MSWKLQFNRRGGSGETTTAKGGVGGDLHVSQYLPSGAVMAAMGDGYQAMITTARAGLVVRPSTVPMATLGNGNAGGGKSLVIERAFAFNLVSTTNPQHKFAIWLCSHPVGVVAVADTITIKNSTSGKAAYGGNAKLALETGVVDDGWYPWGVSGEGAVTALPGAVAIAEVNGRIIVPPTASVSITVVSSLTGQTFTVGFHWHEVQLDLG